MHWAAQARAYLPHYYTSCGLDNMEWQRYAMGVERRQQWWSRGLSILEDITALFEMNPYVHTLMIWKAICMSTFAQLCAVLMP